MGVHFWQQCFKHVNHKFLIYAKDGTKDVPSRKSVTNFLVRLRELVNKHQSRLIQLDASLYIYLKQRESGCELFILKRDVVAPHLGVEKNALCSNDFKKIFGKESAKQDGIDL